MLNTLGNWSDPRSLGVIPLPYVTMLERFPDTRLKIFRDFPDVLSDEYRESALDCANSLSARANDPLMIGYFLRNEPAWAFVDNLILADESPLQPRRQRMQAGANRLADATISNTASAVQSLEPRV